MMGLRWGARYQRPRHELLQLLFLFAVPWLLTERNVVYQIIAAVVDLLIVLWLLRLVLVLRLGSLRLLDCVDNL